MNTPTIYELFVTPGDDRRSKDRRLREKHYVSYLEEKGLNWYLPDLDTYRDYLLNEKHQKPSSVKANIGALRTRYKLLLKDKNLKHILANFAPADEELSLFINRAIDAMEKVVGREAGKIKFDRSLDFSYLSQKQIDLLLTNPGANTLQGVRDTVAFGLMLCTGITETELCALEVSHLIYEDGELDRIHVPEVTEGSDREVPIFDDFFYNKPWLGKYITILLRYSRIKRGALIRGFSEGPNKASDDAVSPRTIQMRLRQYPVLSSNNEQMTVTALVLRRTFARRLHLKGVAVYDLKHYLGHTTIRTTYEYIGLPTASLTEDNRVGDADILLDRLPKGV